MTRYRVEIFGKDFSYKAHAEVSSKTINIDYLALGTSVLVVPGVVEAEENDFITLKMDGVEKYTGLITSLSYGEKSTEITVRSFMSLFDTDVMIDISRLETEAVEDVIAEKLTQMYAGVDPMQAITGFSCVVNHQTIGAVIGEDYVYNLYELIIYLLKKYGVIVHFSLNVPSKTLTCSIDHIDTSSVYIIKASVGDVAECLIDVRAIQSDHNKATYYNELDLTESITYYLHTDGTIDTDANVNRFYPVVGTELVVAPVEDEEDPKTFQEVAYEDALTTLVASEYNNEIDITIKAESSLIQIGQLGQLYSVINYDGTVYTSILTGFEEVNPKYVTLKLGYVRTDLTAILKMQRRGKR